MTISGRDLAIGGGGLAVGGGVATAVTLKIVMARAAEEQAAAVRAAGIRGALVGAVAGAALMWGVPKLVDAIQGALNDN
jgi:hypothetical protein